MDTVVRLNLLTEIERSAEMAKYGIRIDPKQRDKAPYTGRGEVWVNWTEDNYVTKRDARRYSTKRAAILKVTERWEIVERIS